MNYSLSSVKRLTALFLAVALLGCEKENLPMENAAVDSTAAITDLIKGPVNPTQLEGEMSEIFMLGSEYTDLQRENTSNKVVGTNVIWELPVYEVSQESGVYKVLTKSGLMTGDANRKLLNATVFIYPQNDNDRMKMDALKTNDLIVFKGKVADIRLRSLVIVSPAILVKKEASLGAHSETGAKSKRKKENERKSLRWSEIDNNGHMEVTTYIDIASKRKNDNIGKIWRMDNYSESHTRDSRFRSSTYLSEFNCDNEETRVTSDNYFSGAMGTGTPVNVDNAPTPWVPVAPNTVGALVMRVACGI